MNKVIVFYGDDQNHAFYGEVTAMANKDGRLVITSKDRSVHAEFSPGRWTWFVNAPLSKEELAQLSATPEVAAVE